MLEASRTAQPIATPLDIRYSEPLNGTRLSASNIVAFQRRKEPPMSELEFSAPATEIRPPEIASGTPESPKFETAEASAPPETNAKGMLRDAIHKVMEEIELHEREAKRHLQLADTLRKELRDSVKFMIEQKDGMTARAASAKDRPSKTTESSQPESATASAVEKRPRPRKKRRRKKTRSG
jgi:hypothetical protein